MSRIITDAPKRNWHEDIKNFMLIYYPCIANWIVVGVLIWKFIL